MPSVTILREIDVVKTPRVLQLEGIFDVPPSKKSTESWNVNFEYPEEWNIGLIVGASGSGKTTVARELFGENIIVGWEWSRNRCILDDFPDDMSIKEITDVLSSVGFSTPPSWLRPFHVLSNGEQFRVNMARTIAEKKDLAVVDEFTSVVDRTVAKVGSSAIQKTIRRRKQKFIAVSCHYDIIDWLEPDWVYQPATNEFYSGRYLHQRPKINIKIKRVHSSAWQLFRKHHYLNTNINTSAVCFCAFWDDIPVAFSAVLHFPHPYIKNVKREHRTVCLPDYQGIGIGNYLSDYMGAMCTSLGNKYISTTANPAMIYRRAHSNKWIMTKSPKLNSTGGRNRIASLAKTYADNRYTAAFEYVGEMLEKDEAIKVWNGH